MSEQSDLKVKGIGFESLVFTDHNQKYFETPVFKKMDISLDIFTLITSREI